MKKKLLVIAILTMGMFILTPLGAMNVQAASAPVEAVGRWWSNLWGTDDGSVMGRMVEHTQHGITVLSNVMDIIFGNPFLLLMLIFSLLGAGVGLFGRIRRTVGR